MIIIINIKKKKGRPKTAILTKLHQAIDMTIVLQLQQNFHDIILTLETCLRKENCLKSWSVNLLNTVHHHHVSFCTADFTSYTLPHIPSTCFRHVQHSFCTNGGFKHTLRCNPALHMRKLDNEHLISQKTIFGVLKLKHFVSEQLTEFQQPLGIISLPSV